MMKLIAGAVLALVLLSAAGVAYATYTGLSARPAPSWIETRVAKTVQRMSIPKEYRGRPNPAPSDAASLHDAMAHFADHCAICHANDGSGDAEIGRGLYPKPPDLRLPGTQGLSDGELFYIIEHGIRLTGMPAFGNGSAEGEASSWALVRFIRQLPALSPEQLDHMKQMNPRSPEEIRKEIEEQQFLEGATQ
jgi:mono/diheme cytochrome c family protein